MKIITGWHESYGDSNISEFINPSLPGKIIAYDRRDKSYKWHQALIDSKTGRRLSGMIVCYKTMQEVINNLK
jgi:hypothetical protein